MELKYEEVTEEDIPELTTIMARAFDDDSQKHLGIPKGGPDGYDNGYFFRKWLLRYKVSIGYKILLEDKVVGCFIVWVYEHGRNGLGTIFIDPDYQDQGVGSQAWRFIEETYPAKSWTLGTPSWAARNHHFYEKKCGFRKIQEELADEHEGVSFIYRKIMD